MKQILQGLLTIILLFFSPQLVYATNLAQQTQGWNDELNAWQIIQELGSNLSGPLGSFTFRVSTSVPNSQQFNFIAENTQIYDFDLGPMATAVARGCNTDNSPNGTRGLIFNTEGVPVGYEDVTIDFSCNNFNLISGHRYLIAISSANVWGTMLFAGASYGPGGSYSTDLFPLGGVRYQLWDWTYNREICSPTWYVWGDTNPHPYSQCDIWTSPKDDIYFVLSDSSYQPPVPTPSKTPLIFIPGIGGSEFKSTQDFTSDIRDCGTSAPISYKNNDIIWVNKIIAGLSSCDDYLDVLKLQNDGSTPEYPQISLSNTIFQDSYKDVINFLQENGYELNKTLFIFPYDWRKDLSLTSEPLNNLITSIKLQTNSQKVDLVAHSMGGLVAKNYISDSSQASSVRKLVTLGTPYLGSVKLLKALQYGDYFGEAYILGGLSINPNEIKDIIQNFPGAFDLMPSQTYYKFYNDNTEELPKPFRDDSDIDHNNITGSLNFGQIRELLNNFNHNIPLFDLADNFHSQIDQIWQTTTNGVDISLIVGSGQPTLLQIHEQNKIKFHFDIDTGLQVNKREEIFGNGDGTVPLYSASLANESLSFAGPSKIYYSNQEHGNLVNRNTGPALFLLKNLLEDKNELPVGIQTKPYKLNGKAIIIQSPVELNIYDQLGNHTGPTSSGHFETNIPGSKYDTLGSSKHIWLPNEGQYIIKLSATDNGSFDLKIRDFKNDKNTGLILFKDIALTTATQGQMDFDTNNSTPILKIDTNGDGIIDNQYTASATLIGTDQQSPETEIQLNAIQGSNNWFKSDVTVTLNAQDGGASGSGILKTEYSLDNGQTIQEYTSPFSLTKEGITKLQVKSTDKAGNEEYPAKTIEIKIDKTPPEAKAIYNLDSQDFEILGTDNLTNTQATSSANTHYINDEAGNTTQLQLKSKDKEGQEEKEKNDENKLQLRSISYNNSEPIKFLENQLTFKLKLAHKLATLKELEQQLKIEKQIKVEGNYSSKNDQTKLEVKQSEGKKQELIKSGIVLLQLLTKQGQLEAKY